MHKAVEFFKRNSSVILMIVFIAAFYGFLSAQQIARTPDASEKTSAESSSPGFFDNHEEENLKKSIEASPWIALLTFFVLMGGVAVNFSVLIRKLQKRPVFEQSRPMPSAVWGLKQVFFVFTLLYFIEAILIFFEFMIFRGPHLSAPLKDYLTIFNSLIRDVAVASYVIWFVIKKVKLPLGSIGLCSGRVLKDIKTGFFSYIAILPWLLGMLIFLSWLSKALAYEPPAQPVVEMFFKQSMEKYMILFSIFVAILGPAIEEIFFRGFAYQGFRGRFGANRAMLLSALIFAALHMNVIAFFPIFLLGLYLAYLYEKTGSLIPSMTVHMTHNLLMVVITLSIKAALV